jgi:O-acetyl-ADP-ribose deacetylase (regulator of RNase III)
MRSMSASLHPGRSQRSIASPSITTDIYAHALPAQDQVAADQISKIMRDEADVAPPRPALRVVG